ncbi:MAG: hypothetical protein ABI633_00440, partial [Burkholderiales bacterium]
KLINQMPERIYAWDFDRGDEGNSIPQQFADEHILSARRVTVIGAFVKATLGGHLPEAFVRPTRQALSTDSPTAHRGIGDDRIRLVSGSDAR